MRLTENRADEGSAAASLHTGVFCSCPEPNRRHVCAQKVMPRRVRVSKGSQYTGISTSRLDRLNASNDQLLTGATQESARLSMFPGLNGKAAAVMAAPYSCDSVR